MRVHTFVISGLMMLAWATGAAAQDSSYVPQDSPGQVSLRASPTWADTALVIELSVNTHSGDLSAIDLRRQARLRVGDAVLEPAVTGALGGHHARATLVFRMALRPAVPFTLEIRDVPDVAVRTLTWPKEGAD